jgi:hypothetical protein
MRAANESEEHFIVELLWQYVNMMPVELCKMRTDIWMSKGY